MNLNDILSLFSALIALATLTVLVTNPGTATLIKETGVAFSTSLKTAMGR